MKNIRKKFILLLAALTVVISLAPGAAAAGAPSGDAFFSHAQQNWLSKHSALTVGWLDDSKPYITDENGEAVGAVVSYLSEIAQVTGIRLDFVRFDSASELNAALHSGQTDIAAAFYYDEDSAPKSGLLLTDAYYSANFALVTPPEEQKTAAAMTAYNSVCCREYLKKAFPGADMLTCATDWDCLNAVLSGEAQNAVIESYSAQALLRRAQYNGMGFKLLETTYPCRFAVDGDNAELAAVLNTAIAMLDPSVITAEATNLTVASVDNYRAEEFEASRIFYVVATDIMCLAILLLVVIYILINSRYLSKTSHAFLGICGAAILHIVSDAVQNSANGAPGEGARFANEAGSLFMLISSPLLMLGVCMFVYYLISERRKVGRLIVYVGIAYTAVCLVAAVATQFSGMIYSIDDENIYVRGWWINEMFGITLGCMVATGAWLASVKKALSRRELAALLTALLVPTAGFTVQLLLPLVSPANAFMTVGICAAFLSLQSIIFKTERQGRISSQTEIEGLGSVFMGVYRWNTEKGRMDGSVTEPEYAPLLADGALDFDTLINKAVNPADREKMREFLRRDHLDELNASPDKQLREIEYREIGAHDGQWRRVSLIHLPKKNGVEAQLIMAFQDVTYEKSLAEHSSAQRRRLIGAAAGLYTDICEWNMDADSALRLVIDSDGVSEKKLGTSWAEHMRIFREECVMPDDYELFDKILPENIAGLSVGDTVNCAFRVLSGEEYHWNSASIKIFREADGTRTAMYMQQDIDASIREHNYLRDKSEHDALTDLFNRQKLEEMKKEEYVDLQSCGVVFFDINNLKHTNDTLGHDAGDGLIRLAAESIRSITNRHVLAYRIGGDEILVVAENCASEDLEKIIDLWQIRLQALNETARVNCSIAHGSAWKEGDVDIDELIKEADASMYRQKKMMKEPFPG